MGAGEPCPGFSQPPTSPCSYANKLKYWQVLTTPRLHHPFDSDAVTYCLKEAITIVRKMEDEFRFDNKNFTFGRRARNWEKYKK